MPDRSNIVYIYDGSFEGLLCCVFESFAQREIPTQIFSEADHTPTLFSEKIILTDPTKSDRVKKGIITKISIEAYELIVDVFFSCHPEKECLVCAFARLGFRVGKTVTRLLTDDIVCEVLAASKHLHNEAHLLKGFVRFSDYDGALVAVIEPKNYVLPVLSGHFCDRYAGETFLIYDKTHRAALAHRPGEWKIFAVADFQEPEPGEEEKQMRRLWKLFYDTLAIRERENPRCRMSHMPKRYWSHMTEMQDESNSQAPTKKLPEANTPGICSIQNQ